MKIGEVAERLGLRSLLVERVNNLPNEECYIIVYRWLNIGRAAGSEIMIPGAGLDEIHARIVRLGAQFWLHNMAPDGEVTADGTPLPTANICPISAGTALTLASISGQAIEFQQVDM